MAEGFTHQHTHAYMRVCGCAKGIRVVSTIVDDREHQRRRKTIDPLPAAACRYALRKQAAVQTHTANNQPTPQPHAQTHHNRPKMPCNINAAYAEHLHRCRRPCGRPRARRVKSHPRAIGLACESNMSQSSSGAMGVLPMDWGTIEGWQQQPLQLCVPNSRLVSCMRVPCWPLQSQNTQQAAHSTQHAACCMLHTVLAIEAP